MIESLHVNPWLAFTGHMAVATEVKWTQVGALGEGNQNQ